MSKPLESKLVALEANCWGSYRTCCMSGTRELIEIIAKMTFFWGEFLGFFVLITKEIGVKAIVQLFSSCQFFNREKIIVI